MSSFVVAWVDYIVVSHENPKAIMRTLVEKRIDRLTSGDDLSSTPRPRSPWAKHKDLTKEVTWIIATKTLKALNPTRLFGALALSLKANPTSFMRSQGKSDFCGLHECCRYTPLEWWILTTMYYLYIYIYIYLYLSINHQCYDDIFLEAHMPSIPWVREKRGTHQFGPTDRNLPFIELYLENNN